MVASDLSGVPKEFWETGTISVTGGPTRWLPIFQLHKAGARLGLLSTGEWVVETKEGLKGISPEPLEVALLPMLESSQQDAVEGISEALTQRGLLPLVADTLPFARMVLFALRSGSVYWEYLALCWVEHWSANPEMVPILQEITERGLSQKARHLARKILRGWGTSGTSPKQ